MSKNSKRSVRAESRLVEVKSKFDAEFRRFSVDRQKADKFEEFESVLENLHRLKGVPFLICYTDPEGDLLPINNDDNFMKALTTAKPLLRILLQKKGEGYLEVNGFGTLQKKKGPLAKIIAAEPKPRSHVPISLPGDFRRVSAIIDVDVVPETHRRVKLMKNGSDKPLGFYIRDGTSVRVSPHGLEKVPAIFISRLVPGGLAESTGLLAVNDEVLEVNGIEVAGKTLDQVTDMMVANSSNLIITVKPVNQRNNISPYRGGSGRMSQKSTGSYASAQSTPSFGSDEVRDLVQEEEDDEVKDHLSAAEATEQTEATAVNISSSATQSCSTTDSEPVLAEGEDNEATTPEHISSETERVKENGKNSPVITF